MTKYANYTKEQREMIAEFLDTQLPLYKFADNRVGVEWTFIKNTIKVLRTVTDDRETEVIND